MIVGRGGWHNLIFNKYENLRKWFVSVLTILVAAAGIFSLVVILSAAISPFNTTPDFANCSNDECCPDPTTHFIYTISSGRSLNHDDNAAKPQRTWCMPLDGSPPFPTINQDDLARKVGEWIAKTS